MNAWIFPTNKLYATLGLDVMHNYILPKHLQK